MMKVELLFAWYDFWIGLFWDKKKRWLYILPIPMFGIILKFPNRMKKHLAQYEAGEVIYIDNIEIHRK